MKDKLRELAERWKRRASLSNSKGYLAFANNKCAAELLAVLDAEAMAGAVAWFTDDHLSDKSATTYSKEVADRWSAKGWPVNPLYPHPARSGVVSDEDVEDAARYRWLRDDPPLELAVRRKNPRPMYGDCAFTYLDADALDQAIDAARKGERHE